MSAPTQLDRIEEKLNRLLAQTSPPQPENDDKIFKAPSAKYWQGDDFTGCKMSECAPDFLRAFAKYKRACAWANRKEGDPNKAQYADKDEATAKTALAWAAYQEAAGVVTAPKITPRAEPASAMPEYQDEPPF